MAAHTWLIVAHQTPAAAGATVHALSAPQFSILPARLDRLRWCLRRRPCVTSHGVSHTPSTRLTAAVLIPEGHLHGLRSTPTHDVSLDQQFSLLAIHRDDACPCPCISAPSNPILHAKPCVVEPCHVKHSARPVRLSLSPASGLQSESPVKICSTKVCADGSACHSLMAYTGTCPACPGICSALIAHVHQHHSGCAHHAW